MTRDLFGGVSEQTKASKHRLDDARALLNEDRWRGAMYMAGYAIECLLKAKLMRMYKCWHLRDLEDELRRRDILSVNTTIFTHQLEVLMRLTQGWDRLRQNREVLPLFNLVNQWVPAWRYAPNRSSPEDARDFLQAIDAVSQWIENNV